MHFAPDDSATGHFIQGYDETGIVIGGRRHTATVLVCAERVESPWDAGDLARLSGAPLEQLVALAPQVLLLGTGRRAWLPRPELLQPFGRLGIGVEVMTTEAACRTYNLLLAEGRRVVAVLLPPAAETGG
jgi:uncharacterized protein